MYVVALVTAPQGDAAAALASKIVSSRLAACVNILPAVTSVYAWEGRVHSDAEALLVIKTRHELADALAAFVRAHHTYSVPEVIVTPIVAGSAPYLAWIGQSTVSASEAAAVLASVPARAPTPPTGSESAGGSGDGGGSGGDRGDSGGHGDAGRAGTNGTH
jgi:periplasmic divalent cation tolerance protein